MTLCGSAKVLHTEACHEKSFPQEVAMRETCEGSRVKPRLAEAGRPKRPTAMPLTVMESNSPTLEQMARKPVARP